MLLNVNVDVCLFSQSGLDQASVLDLLFAPKCSCISRHHPLHHHSHIFHPHRHYYKRRCRHRSDQNLFVFLELSNCFVVVVLLLLFCCCCFVVVVLLLLFCFCLFFEGVVVVVKKHNDSSLFLMQCKRVFIRLLR